MGLFEGLLLSSPPPTPFPFSETESNDKVTNTQFLCKVIFSLHMERLDHLLCGLRLCTDWQAVSEQRGGLLMT